MLKWLIALGALLALPAPVYAAPTTYTTDGNSTCATDGSGCVRAIPVMNPDGTFIGGGGSGGSGGAVTAVSGAYATGSIVDIGNAASPATGTVNARLEAIRALIAAPLTVTTAVTPGTALGGAQQLFLMGCRATSSQPSAVGTGTAVTPWCGLNGQIASVVSDAAGFQATTTDSTNDALSVSLRGLVAESMNRVYNLGAWSFQRGNADGTNTLTSPTASATASLSSATVAAVTSNQLKNSAGNVYSLNLVNSTTAGFVVLYDSATVPAASATLTTGLIRYCYQVPASGSYDKNFPMPMQMTAGAVELFSTSCTVYTAVSPAPVIMTGQVK